MTDQTVAIGSRLELFTDRLLVESVQGTTFKMHTPQLTSPEPSAFRGDYLTVIKDGELYRGYFRRYAKSYTGESYDGHPGELTCYVESSDGCNWTEPDLGLFEVDGTTHNNVILANAAPFTHNFAPFLDANPNAAPEARFKALAGVHGKAKHNVIAGLHAFQSPDGIHWQKLHDTAVINHEDFAFDSQNVSFWSVAENCYVCYFRTWVTPHGRMRTVSRTTSPDFIHWSPPVAMNPNRPGENIYTSQAHPYYRAPHLYVCLPTRYFHARGSSTDIAFMTTRAGSTHFDRLSGEAWIRPGLDPARWGNRANYAACGIVQTSDTHMSLYHGRSGLRYTLRIDGFVSINAGIDPGELITRPITFSGSQLVLNYSTSAAGSVAVEIQRPDGTPIPGFTLEDAAPLVGDAIEQTVQWKDAPNLVQLEGQPVRLRFVMTEADVFSYRFGPA